MTRPPLDRAMLAAICDHPRMTQREAAEIFGTHQPVISALVEKHGLRWPKKKPGPKGPRK